MHTGLEALNCECLDMHGGQRHEALRRALALKSSWVFGVSHGKPRRNA